MKEEQIITEGWGGDAVFYVLYDYMGNNRYVIAITDLYVKQMNIIFIYLSSLVLRSVSSETFACVVKYSQNKDKRSTPTSKRIIIQ
jgi:hypothetical protein